jgi:hypothetical protein
MVAHNQINFNLRPSKRIERRLIADKLASIYRFDDPARYGYIGMGSVYFTDFALFHKVFGINEMVSIEEHAASIARCDFNKPYGCISVVEGTTNAVLPTLNLFNTNPVICWLDYYSYLTTSILADIETFVRKAKIGSFLAITMNSALLNSAERIEGFFAGLPAEYSSNRYKREAVSIAGLQNVMLKIIESRLESTLADINIGATNSNKKQLLRMIDIAYKDNVQMITFGWILANNKIKRALRTEPSMVQNFVPKRIELHAPALTFKEVNHLKALLPLSLTQAEFEAKSTPVRPVDANRFAEFYRFYPQFADVEE